MTAISLTEASIEDIPMSGKSGTQQRRAHLHLRYTVAAGLGTIDLTGVDAGIADVIGITYETDSGAVAATSATWSTSTLSPQVVGDIEIGLIVRFT